MTHSESHEEHYYYNEQGGKNEPSTAEGYFDSLADQFAALPMAIFEDVRSGKLNARDICLYTHFLAKQGVNRTSYWGIDRLAELTATSETTVKSSIRRLVSAGHIARLPSAFTTHTVCLTRLDPRKGSRRILIKDTSLIPPSRKTGEASNVGKPSRKKAYRGKRFGPDQVLVQSKSQTTAFDQPIDSVRNADEFSADEEAEF